jgi:hypothetical protein
MIEEVCAEVPDDLADELIDQGFEEYLAFRSDFLTDAGTVITVAANVLAIGGNAVLIMVSREEVGKFVTAVRDWILRKKPAQPDSVVSIDISARCGEDKMRLHLQVESDNGAPHLDTSALSSLVSSLFAELPGESEPDDTQALA